MSQSIQNKKAELMLKTRVSAVCNYWLTAVCNYWLSENSKLHYR